MYLLNDLKLWSIHLILNMLWLLLPTTLFAVQIDSIVVNPTSVAVNMPFEVSIYSTVPSSDCELVDQSINWNIDDFNNIKDINLSLAYSAGEMDMPCSAVNTITITPPTGETGFFRLRITATENTLSDVPESITQTVVKIGNVGTFGEYYICGRIWNDYNGNGQLDADEDGAAAVSVNASEWDAVSPTTTDEYGFYCITELVAVNYVVTTSTFDLPQGAYAILPEFHNIDLNNGQNAEAENVDFAFQYPDSGLLLGAIGGKVWLDANGDAIVDDGEAGRAGTTIYLERIGQGTFTRDSTLTDAEGNYLFSDLEAGYYVVVLDYDVAFQYEVTVPTPNASYGFTLNPEEERLELNFGLYEQQLLAENSTISGSIFYDENLNGIKDSNEDTWETLYNTAIGLTNGNGLQKTASINNLPSTYSFNHLTVGENTLQTLDDYYLITTDTIIHIENENTISNLDIGFIRSVNISGFVFNDINQNGIKENGEQGISGINIQIFQNQELIQTLATNYIGQYNGSIHPLTDYTIIIDTVQLNTLNYSLTQDTIYNINLLNAQSASNLNFGIHTPNSSLKTISGSVWYDANDNGNKEETESGVINAIIELYDENDALITLAQTNYKGKYEFNEVLIDGAYSIRVSKNSSLNYSLSVSPSIDINLPTTENIDFPLTSDELLEPPVAVNDTVKLELTNEEPPYMIPIVVLNNDYDPQSSPLALAAAIDTATEASVTVGFNNTLAYTVLENSPHANLITYYIYSEVYGLVDSAQVVINVEPPPIEAHDDYVSTPINTAIDINVLENDEGEHLAILNALGARNGTTLVSSDGQSITYTPDPTFSGLDTFTYTVLAPPGQGDTAQVIVGVGMQFNQVTGTIYHDENEDCIRQADEIGLKERMLVAVPGNYYAVTDSNGKYTLNIYGAGDYTILQVNNYGEYWTQSCADIDGHMVNFTEDYGESIGNQNFANSAVVGCPLLTVNIGTALARRCFLNDYVVWYCNEGTADAENAYVEVVVDDDIIPLSSSIPWVAANGVYTFELGTVRVGECNYFTITDSISCTAFLESSVCVQAHIYPDTLCTPVSELWDGASIKVTGECVGDSIQYTVINEGNGDMSNPSNYRIYEDNVLVMKYDFQLGSNESLAKMMMANGSTFRIEADQVPEHPEESFPKVSVELCGGNPEMASLGYMNTVGHDDRMPHLDIDCEQVTGSFDPNDKTAVPSGITDENFVLGNDEITYKIRFQNTGNDTAFTVVVVDTLTKYLDITTVKSGVSSHPYTFEILGQNVLRWTFNNILLPDSTTNEPGSHGFVKFTIKQANDNATGHVIKNSAAIYFDYNEAIITVPYILKVNEKAHDIVGIYVAEQPNIKLKTYPNPSQGQLTFELPNDTYSQSYTLAIYNLLGQEVKRWNQLTVPNFTIDINDLNSGVYLYRLLDEKNGQQSIANGKFVLDKK